MCVIHLSFWGMYFIQRQHGQEEWPVLAALGIIVLEVWWCVLGCLSLVFYCFRHKNERCYNLVCSAGLKEYGESAVLPRLWVHCIGNSLSSWALLLEFAVLCKSGVTFEPTCVWFSSALWDLSVHLVDTIQQLFCTFYFFRKRSGDCTAQRTHFTW